MFMIDIRSNKAHLLRPWNRHLINSSFWNEDRYNSSRANQQTLSPSRKKNTNDIELMSVETGNKFAVIWTVSMLRKIYVIILSSFYLSTLCPTFSAPYSINYKLYKKVMGRWDKTLNF